MGLQITPDFSEAQEQEQITPGVYNVRVDSVEQKTSKAGAAYLSWKLVIFGASDDLAKQNNRPVFLTTMTAGPGAGILKQFIKATVGTVGAAFNTDDIISKELQVTLVARTKPDGTPGWPEVKTMKALTH